ncbi:hypothetical protein A5658_07995 [Mycobacterium sp. 1245111.1]|uniref:hypothetical protein n=1 Tax=Mycobacterium sp. 1245111.1 TaxID=1834073 RepID=UPI0007FD8DF7|nr:hypothetical protein [Mycobacterium sp. 1245111.1]OBK35356.1 hypothetical protein A5658_07995 [Mycobacterium sp. 1245111.1]
MNQSNATTIVVLYISAQAPTSPPANHADARVTEVKRRQPRLVRHIIFCGGKAVDRIATFVLPYVQDVHRRGEVREGIDVEQASEWLARIVFSLATVGPARSFDLNRPETVRKHMEEFGISGLR